MNDPKQTLDDGEIERKLQALPGWEIVDGCLHRKLEFPDFAAAFGFMASVAIVADKADHHPDWSNSYNTVVIKLKSHDVDALTQRDVDLAQRISELCA